MIYGERIVDGEVEKGVFLSLAEFAEYRHREGWESTAENNALADQWLKDVGTVSDMVK